jgi:uncharacterized DUF497 family protein
LGLKFTWDEQKAATNLTKHGVDFHEAGTIFNDPHSITVDDDLHSFDEVRYFTIGRSAHGRLLSVAHTEDDDRIRIISARPATRAEANQYDEP